MTAGAAVVRWRVPGTTSARSRLGRHGRRAPGWAWSDRRRRSRSRAAPNGRAPARRVVRDTGGSRRASRALELGFWAAVARWRRGCRWSTPDQAVRARATSGAEHGVAVDVVLRPVQVADVAAHARAEQAWRRVGRVGVQLVDVEVGVATDGEGGRDQRGERFGVDFEPACGTSTMTGTSGARGSVRTNDKGRGAFLGRS